MLTLGPDENNLLVPIAIYFILLIMFQAKLRGQSSSGAQK